MQDFILKFDDTDFETANSVYITATLRLVIKELLRIYDDWNCVEVLMSCRWDLKTSGTKAGFFPGNETTLLHLPCSLP